MSLHKSINGECSNCESTFLINYTDMMASKEYPEYCPFCGEFIEELSEDYIEESEDEFDDEETWHQNGNIITRYSQKK